MNPAPIRNSHLAIIAAPCGAVVGVVVLAAHRAADSVSSHPLYALLFAFVGIIAVGAAVCPGVMLWATGYGLGLYVLLRFHKAPSYGTGILLGAAILGGCLALCLPSWRSFAPAGTLAVVGAVGGVSGFLLSLGLNHWVYRDRQRFRR